MRGLGNSEFHYDPQYGFVNRRSKHQKKKAGIYGIAVTIVLALAATFTIMYLTSLTPTVTNAFSVGEGDVNIVEPGVDPGNVPWGTDTKPVRLEIPSGDSNIPGVVRAMVIPVLKDKETGEGSDGELGSLTEPTGNTLVVGDITLHFADDWSSNWFYKDGYFYYKRVLKPGEQTTNLLSGVTLTDGSLSQEYADLTVEIEVLADVLQIDGDAPEKEWNVSVGSNGIVTPK